MKKLILAAAALALAAGAFAQAPVAPAAGATTPAAVTKPVGAKGERLKKIDANGDGQISAAEAKGHPRLEKNFAAIDTNKDGQLSKDEIKAFRAAHKGERAAKKVPAAKS